MKPGQTPFAFSVFGFPARIRRRDGRCARARDSLQREQELSPKYIPTSVHLARLLDYADGARVTVGWLMERLGERSFGLTLFLLALLAFIPGIASVSGILIVWPAVQMLLGHDAAVLPGFVARRELRVGRLSRAIRFATPKLEWVERLIRPRWPTPFRATKRLTGLVMLLLGLTMILPVPLGQLLPALVVMLLALAYLEEDGIALMVALVAALVSIAITTATVWGTIETIGWIDLATHNP